MFTRMSEVQILNAASFEKFNTLLGWKFDTEEVVSNKVISDASEITELKNKFAVADGNSWVIKSIFGLDWVMEYNPVRGVFQIKFWDADLDKLMIIPFKMVSGVVNWNIELSVSTDDQHDTVVYHVVFISGTGSTILEKYIVLSGIE